MLTGFYQKRKKKLVKGIKIFMKKKNQYLEYYKIFLKIKKDSRIKKKLLHITSKIIELKKVSVQSKTENQLILLLVITDCHMNFYALNKKSQFFYFMC